MYSVYVLYMALAMNSCWLNRFRLVSMTRFLWLISFNLLPFCFPFLPFCSQGKKEQGRATFIFRQLFFLHSNPYIPVCRVGGSVVSVFLEWCPAYSESCRSRKPYRGGVLKHAAPIVYRNIQHSNREWMESTRIYRCTITGWLLVSFCAIIPRFL